MPDPRPVKKVLPAGRYAFCRCGKTANAPLCDGSHGASGVTPELVVLDGETKTAWCTCRESKTLPMCDGTHRKYWPSSET